MRNALFTLIVTVGTVRHGFVITARTAVLLLLLLASIAQPAIAQQNQQVVIDCLPPWETNDRFRGAAVIKHPSLSLNGFDCGSNCDIGYGLKQVIEKVYGSDQDEEVKDVFKNMVNLARRTFKSDNSKGNVNANTQILQARGFVALAAYVLHNNDYDPTNPIIFDDPILPSAAQAVESFRTALLDTRWRMRRNIEKDGVKWATPVASVARAIDLYLALENAYKHYDPDEYRNFESTTILSILEKNNAMNRFTTLIENLEARASKFFGLVSRYNFEPGNASLVTQIAIGYAALTWQQEKPPYVIDIALAAARPENMGEFIRRAFEAASGDGSQDRKNNWRYQSSNGKHFWAEGPYYFHLTLGQVVSFWHTIRINEKLASTGFHDSDFRDIFFSTDWFLNPLRWLADISAPDGKIPPLDDGNKETMYSADLFRWKSTYGNNDIGEKFARIVGAIESAKGLSLWSPFYPVALAIPRRPVSDSSLVDGVIGNEFISRIAGETGRQEVVVRRTIDDKQHYLLLNGESGDAIERGEGHEQADQMQLLYYVDDTSFLVDSGYDTAEGIINSTWNHYGDHNIMTMEPDTDGFFNNDRGIRPPFLNPPPLHFVSQHQDVHEIYHQIHGEIDLISASIDLVASNHILPFYSTTKMANYYRNVLFIRDATHPYIVDINAVSRIGEFTNWYKMFYHGNSNTVVDRLYYNKPAAREWINIHTSEESSSPTPIRNRSLFIQPFAIERRLVSSIQSDEIRETRISEERGTGINIKKLLIRGNEPSNGSSKGHFTTVAFMHVLFDGEEIEFIKENRPLSNASGDRGWQYYTWSPRDEVSPGEPDSTIVDVVVARSAAQYVNSDTSSSLIKLHFPIAEADSFYLELSSEKNYGFARLRKQGQTWSIDPDFKLNVEESQLEISVSGPDCLIDANKGRFISGTRGGTPPYLYLWSRYRLCDGPSPNSRDCKIWVDDAGTTPYIDYGRYGNDNFKIRVKVTDSSAPQQSVTSDELEARVLTSTESCPSNTNGSVNPENEEVFASDADLLEAEQDIPETYALRQNFPNPFNPSTEIPFDLPEDVMVSLVVYDVLGREVARLVQEELRAGTHRARFDARNLPSGIYFYRIQAGDFYSTHRMTLLK